MQILIKKYCVDTVVGYYSYGFSVLIPISLKSKHVGQ